MKRAVLSSALLLLILLAGLAFRWVDLRADPPAQFSNSGGDYLDGMANAHTARAYVQSGVWRGDDWDTYVYSPTYTLLQVVWFRWTGISVSSTNGFGALFASLYLLAMAWSVKRAARPEYARVWPLLAALFCSLSAVLLAYGRMALFENTMVFFLIAGTLALRPQHSAGAFVLGIGCFLAYATKAIGLYALPAGLMGALWSAFPEGSSGGRLRWPDLFRQASAWIAGVLLIALPWWFLYHLPEAGTIQHFGAMWSELSFPRSLPDAVLNAARTSIFHSLGQYDLVLACAVLTLGWLAWRVVVAPGEIPPLVVYAGTWLVGGIALIIPLSYTPTRYFYPLLPAAIVVASYGLARLVQADSLKANRAKPWLYTTSGIALLLILRFLVVPHLPWLDQFPGTWPRAYRFLLIAALLTLIVFPATLWITTRFPLPGRLSRALRIGVVSIVAAHFLYGNLGTLHHRFTHRNYSIRKAALSVARLPTNTVVGGTCALAAVMESSYPAVRIGKPGWYNDDWMQRQPPVTHLFLTGYGDEYRRFKTLHPEIMSACTTVQTFKVCGYPFYLLARGDLHVQ